MLSQFGYSARMALIRSEIFTTSSRLRTPAAVLSASSASAAFCNAARSESQESTGHGAGGLLASHAAIDLFASVCAAVARRRPSPAERRAIVGAATASFTRFPISFSWSVERQLLAFSVPAVARSMVPQSGYSARISLALVTRFAKSSAAWKGFGLASSTASRALFAASRSDVQASASGLELCADSQDSSAFFAVE